MKKLLFFPALLFLSVSLLSAQDGWQYLFNGKNLNGWEQLNGTAKYYMEDGMLIGETVMGSPNSFLCTKKHFGDFILEYDVLLEPAFNSGVQIRSESSKDYMNGRVHGYQVEIDPSLRRWSGGIYDEARRGWLYNLERNPKGKDAFHMGQWNHFHVEAIGDEIRTWINGVMCANLVDTMTSSGFIGLQVHNIGQNKALAGKKIRWKNIRILTTGLDTARWAPDPDVPVISYLDNKLTPEEVAEGWKLLWDGKTTNGWRGAKLDHFPDKGWQIKDGILTVLEGNGGESENGGDIITDRTYRNFVLQVDFKITKGANSGIKYFVDPNLNKGAGSAIGCEFQILDNKNHPDAKKGTNGNRTLASLYDLIPAQAATQQLQGYTRQTVNGWYRARIVVRGCHVEHWLNNIKVVEYDRCGQMWRALVARSKYHVWPHFGEAREGHILLQDHGNEVSFKNIKILELNNCGEL